MTTLLSKVHPGDIISSQLINEIIEEIALLQGDVKPNGSQTVPNVFGNFLVDAKALITQPVRQLSMGFVIDSSGAAIDPNASANAQLVVLNQSPVANTRVSPGTPINLIVSKAETSSGPGPGGNLSPAITGFETIAGAAASSFPVGSTLVIVGNRFNSNTALNIVTFDGVSASLTADPSDPTRKLLVQVPAGIPDAPVNDASPSKTGVVVSIRTGSGSPATATITLTAPLSQQPNIISVVPASQFENDNITISGTNFTNKVKVFIRDRDATIVNVTTTKIIVKVPDFEDILSGSLVPSSIKVVVEGNGDDTFMGTFRVRGTNN